MKILQINSFHYRRGGADVVYLNTSQLLRERGHEVINFSKQSDRNLEVLNPNYFINDIDFFNNSTFKKIIKVPRFLYSLESKQKLESLIINERPDIAHIHSYKGTLTPSILLALKKHNIPVAITLHDYGLLCPHNSFLNGKGEICEKCLVSNNSINCIISKCNRNNIFLSTISSVEYLLHKRVYPFSKHFDILIAVSKFGMMMHSKKSEIKDKIVHLYNFYPKLESTISNSKKGSYFLFYGRLSSEKGIISLMKAWKKLKSDLILKIAGEGRLLKDIIEFIAENGLTNIEVLGFVQGKTLDVLISNASFIIVPSEWYENNPLTIIEAYSNGKPVIASNVGGIPEIVIENETGFLYEMKNVDKLYKTIHKASELTSEEYLIMSRKSREFAENNFSEEKHYIELINIYNQLLLKAKK